MPVWVNAILSARGRYPSENGGCLSFFSTSRGVRVPVEVGESVGVMLSSVIGVSHSGTIM